jgi:hypothetical protein
LTGPGFAGPACHHGGVTTAIIVVTLVLLALGIVINQLFRLKDWLKNAPPVVPPGPVEPPDDEIKGPPEAPT